jgi:hypothetical protein
MQFRREVGVHVHPYVGAKTHAGAHRRRSNRKNVALVSQYREKPFSELVIAANEGSQIGGALKLSPSSQWS